MEDLTLLFYWTANNLTYITNNSTLEEEGGRACCVLYFHFEVKSLTELKVTHELSRSTLNFLQLVPVCSVCLLPLKQVKLPN